MKKWLARSRGLSVQIVLIVLIAWLAPTLVLGTSVTAVFFPALRAQSEAALEMRAHNLFDRMNDDVSRLVTLAKDVTYDGELTGAHSRKQSGIYSYQEFYRVTKNYLERRFSRNPRIRYAAYFSVDAVDQFIFTSSGYPLAMFFQSHSQKALIEIGKTLDTRCSFVYLGDQLLLVRNLYDSRLERFGMLVLCLNEDELMRPLVEGVAAFDGEVMVRLGDERLMEAGYHLGDADFARLSPGLSAQDDRLIYRLSDATRDYVLDMAIAKDSRALYAEIDRFGLILVGLLIMLIPVCVLVLFYVHKRVIRPITTLSEAAVRIEQGHLGEPVEVSGPTEIEHLGQSFSHMSQELIKLIDTVYNEEIALRDAQIQAMQSRVNPHFLNNALEMINWQARMDGEDAICNMVDALSVLMNAALDRDNDHLVPLREELQIAGAYFYFLAQRFGERISLCKEVDETLLDERVPRLIIQTLLENAAEHGIAPAGGGRIVLHVRRGTDMLEISTVNDGQRPTPQVLDKVERIISGDDSGSHFGLANVAKRLRLIYMGRASVRFYLDDQGDTVAQLYIPLEDAPRA